LAGWYLSLRTRLIIQLTVFKLSGFVVVGLKVADFRRGVVRFVFCFCRLGCAVGFRVEGLVVCVVDGFVKNWGGFVVCRGSGVVLEGVDCWQFVWLWVWEVVLVCRYLLCVRGNF